MKRIIPVIIVIVCFACMVIPVSSQSAEESILESVKNISVTVPPTGSAILGAGESMTQYQGWLEEIADALITFSNNLLSLLGLEELNWSVSSTPATTASAVQPITTTPAPAIRESPGLTTISTITGGSGRQTVNVNVPVGYWELWYTADPLVTGGQDSTSSTGTNSALFPSLSIKITDAATSAELKTIEPPGGLDKNLWQRSGDPRPWSEKFYKGYREFTFDITARHVNSYVLEIRVPEEK